MNTINKLKWDSDFFKLKVGSLNIDASTQSSQIIADSFDLLYVMSSHDFDFKLKNFSCSLVESKVCFSKKLFRKVIDTNNIISIKDIDFDIKRLYLLAFESGKLSRFKRDKNFSDSTFFDLYKMWIDNSINQTFADDILVFTNEQEVLGFISYKIKSESATVGLFAILPNFQGKGIGNKLLSYLEQILVEKGIKTLYIPTQLENLAACNFYKKNKYDIDSIIYLKHFWNNDTI